MQHANPTDESGYSWHTTNNLRKDGLID